MGVSLLRRGVEEVGELTGYAALAELECRGGGA
jgi:phage FluMu protein gp41